MRRFGFPTAQLRIALLFLAGLLLVAGLAFTGASVSADDFDSVDDSDGTTAGQKTAARETRPSASVDDRLRQSWKENDVTPAKKSGDAEFCRRVWMDLAGVAPPVWQLRRFLADSDPDKRDRLIDQLLESPRFAYHMANRWNDFLLPPDESGNQQLSESALHGWLRNQFLQNTPYDHLVGAFLTAGGTGESGPAIFYTSRDLEPPKVAAATSRLFMGIQLECAQCHDHPFADWSQEDFWSFAAFFAQLEQGDPGRMGQQSIEDRRGREVTLPDSDQVMPPRYPGSSEPPEPDPTDFRRRQLTIWLASKNNPYFARSAANRVWSHLFGRGLVEPVDAMDADNPASHPELLQHLADFLVRERFDLKTLYRMLARTDAYALSSVYENVTRPSPDAFAVMQVKTLSAEQYFDSLAQNVLKLNEQSTSEAPSSQAVARRQFLSRMKAANAAATEYPHGVVQALAMMNGPEILAASQPDQSGLLGSLEAPFFTDDDRIETLFLACLSRTPSASERELFRQYLKQTRQNEDHQSKLSDLAWSLLNTAECYLCP